MARPFIFHENPFDAYSEVDFEDEWSWESKVRRPAKPGGGRFQRELQDEFRPIAPGGGRFEREEEIGPAFCVPAAPILNAAAVSRAVAGNARFRSLLGWGTLIDQIEVNLLGCPRANGRLAAADFAQAVAQFQTNQGLNVDGMLGPNTWTRMKTLRAERDPFPRVRILPGRDFDSTPNAGNCELAVHPAIDIDVPAGTPIPAVADGRVIYAGDVGTLASCAAANDCVNGTCAGGACATLSYGRAVIIEHPDRGPGPQPRGLSMYTIYAHVQFSGRRRISSGEPVLAGRLIAEVGAGCVGCSNVPHLHYVTASGPRGFRFTRGGPARLQICGDFWPVLVPRRPRTSGANAGFAW